MARINQVKRKIELLSIANVSSDETLTEAEKTMLDSFRKLDDEKRKMLIDTAQAWHKLN